MSARPSRRAFGWVEVAFDALYLLFGLALGIWSLSRPGELPHRVGAIALTLSLGDAFHLVPRVFSALTGRDLHRALGLGKLITSITMTAFYILLWRFGARLYGLSGLEIRTGIACALAGVRTLLCLAPQNGWMDEAPPVRWGVYRNIPFLLLGVQVAALFAPRMPQMAVAIFLSFAFYLPVVLFAHRDRRIGMLMLPKTLSYVWILLLCFTAA